MKKVKNKRMRKCEAKESDESIGSHFTNIYFTLNKHEQSFKSLGA